MIIKLGKLFASLTALGLFMIIAASLMPMDNSWTEPVFANGLILLAFSFSLLAWVSTLVEDEPVNHRKDDE